MVRRSKCLILMHPYRICVKILFTCFVTCISLPHRFMCSTRSMTLITSHHWCVLCWSCTLTRSQELASSRPHRCPEVGRELLGVLVLQDELGYGSFPQRPACPHRPHTPLLLHQLTVHQGHQLPLHGPTEHAGTQARHTCSRRYLCDQTVYLRSFITMRTFTLVISHF